MIYNELRLVGNALGMNKGNRYQDAYEQFLQGEIDLFYKEVYPTLLVFTRRLLPSTLVYLAEDCVQDSIFKLYRQRSEMSSPERAKSFLYVCIHNAVVSYIRKDNSRQHFISQDNDSFEDDFSVELIRQETIDELMGAVDRLPDDMRQLCMMIFREGLKTSEIAQQLNMTKSGVKKKKRRLLDLLRKSLSPEALFFASIILSN
jgi:RNA polymerase sigma factor (sigma-70 family)